MKQKDKKLRAEFKFKRCAVAGCSGTPDPAHVRTWKTTRVDADFNIIPLCRKHHSFQHSKGWRQFLDQHPEVGELLIKLGWEIEYIELPAGNVFRLSHKEMTKILRGEESGIKLN